MGGGLRSRLGEKKYYPPWGGDFFSADPKGLALTVTRPPHFLCMVPSLKKQIARRSAARRFVPGGGEPGGLMISLFFKQGGREGQSQGRPGWRSVAQQRAMGAFFKQPLPAAGSVVWPRPGSGMGGRTAPLADRLLFPVPFGADFGPISCLVGESPSAGGWAGWVCVLPYLAGEKAAVSKKEAAHWRLANTSPGGAPPGGTRRGLPWRKSRVVLFWRVCGTGRADWPLPIPALADPHFQARGSWPLSQLPVPWLWAGWAGQ